MSVSSKAWRRAAVAAALAGAICAAPIPVRADGYALMDSSICTISQLVVQMSAPLSVTPQTGPLTFTVTAAGVCVGTTAGAFSMTGNGATAAPSSCVLLVASGQSTVSINGGASSVYFDIAGPTAAPLMTFATGQANLGGVTGTALLSLSPASLQACLLPGGTTSLEYSGTSVFAL